MWLGVDANQGYSIATLRAVLPHFVRFGAALVEQPLPRDRDTDLDEFFSPIPLAADESLQLIYLDGHIVCNDRVWGLGA